MSDFAESGVLTVDDFLSDEECRNFIIESERIGYSDAPIESSEGTLRVESIRNNGRVIVDDVGLAGLLWSRVRAHIPPFLDGHQAIGVNERVRFYRYEPGQHFSLHTDGAFRRTNAEESRLTLIVYLNDDYTGGETAFVDRIITPRTGKALIFRHELPHEGRTIERGVKYALRSDIMFNPIGRLSSHALT